jgi:hypothetical protein
VQNRELFALYSLPTNTFLLFFVDLFFWDMGKKNHRRKGMPAMDKQIYNLVKT